MNHEHAHHMAEAVTGSIDALGAWWGGFSSFYSIWFFCLFQISPFFIAFIIATAASAEGGIGDRLKKTIMPALLCSIGYIVLFSALGATASSTGMALLRYNSLLGQLGGILALLLGAWYLSALRFPRIPDAVVINVGGLFLGIALALSYRPCVTPTLTLIYNLTQSPDTVASGTGYLAVYAVGVCMGIVAAALALSALILMPSGGIAAKGARVAGGVLLIVFGILVVADLMTAYKGFLVGGLV
ncbi:MAG: cytochrome c biogenesis protein CcdA [Nitrospirota bacterium]|nr:cytochrome c biogenesis protein CcdA [Nitrospirota bacterium]